MLGVSVVDHILPGLCVVDVSVINHVLPGGKYVVVLLVLTMFYLVVSVW